MLSSWFEKLQSWRAWKTPRHLFSFVCTIVTVSVCVCVYMHIPIPPLWTFNSACVCLISRVRLCLDSWTSQSHVAAYLPVRSQCDLNDESAHIAGDNPKKDRSETKWMLSWLYWQCAAKSKLAMQGNIAILKERSTQSSDACDPCDFNLWGPRVRKDSRRRWLNIIWTRLTLISDFYLYPFFFECPSEQSHKGQ